MRGRLARVAVCAVTIAALMLPDTGVARSSSGYVEFSTPSHNIYCYATTIAAGGIGCALQHSNWMRPKRPCADGDWIGNAIGIDGFKTYVGACRGDPPGNCYRAAPGCRIIAYGTSLRFGPFRCDSRTNGLTCRRVTGSRHNGFFVSRESYRIYRA